MVGKTYNITVQLVLKQCCKTRSTLLSTFYRSLNSLTTSFLVSVIRISFRMSMHTFISSTSVILFLSCSTTMGSKTNLDSAVEGKTALVREYQETRFRNDLD